jgi:hypothetical protein
VPPQGLAASQRVGDRYYVPRNLTILAGLKARRGRIAEADALYEQAEDVIEGMLISVDEPPGGSRPMALTLFGLQNSEDTKAWSRSDWRRCMSKGEAASG